MWKKGHFKKECPSKSPINSLISKDISTILELDHPESESPNSSISVLSKQEELLLDLIEQIEDPVTKAQRLSEFHKTLVKEASTSKPRIQEPKVDLEKIYNRFTKSKKEITVQDLQKEIKDTKSEVRTLKQELIVLRVDHNLIDQSIKQLENISHQGNEESTSL